MLTNSYTHTFIWKSVKVTQIVIGEEVEKKDNNENFVAANTKHFKIPD